MHDYLTNQVNMKQLDNIYDMNLLKTTNQFHSTKLSLA